MPLFSVVIPVYNKQRYIVRALSSVLAQTFQEFEIVVVDDGSTDESGAIVHRHVEPRIRLFQQANQGASVARNRGIAESRFDLIAFLDADDEWLGAHLETLARLYKLYPGCGAYSTAYKIARFNGTLSQPQFKAIPKYPWEGLIPNYFKSAALGEPPLWTSAVAIPRAIFNEVGLFKPGEKMGEDLDMWGRIALNWEIAFSTEQTAVYHLDASGRTCLENVILEKQLPFVKTVGSLVPHKKTPFYLQMYVSEMKFLYIESLLQKGERSEARKEFFSIHVTSSRKRSLFRFMFLVFLPYRVVLKIRKIKKWFCNLCCHYKYS